MRGLRGGAHEIFEPSELDVKGAVSVRDADSSCGEGCRVEGGGSCDSKVDAVREIRTLVKVWVEQREAKILSCNPLITRLKTRMLLVTQNKELYAYITQHDIRTYRENRS